MLNAADMKLSYEVLLPFKYSSLADELLYFGSLVTVNNILFVLKSLLIEQPSSANFKFVSVLCRVHRSLRACSLTLQHARLFSCFSEVCHVLLSIETVSSCK